MIPSTDLKAHFASLKIALFGDTIIDKHVELELLKPSEGSTSPTYGELSTKYSLGGAALVMRNFRNLGVTKIEFATNCPNGETIKSRYWLNNQKLFQIDHFPAEGAIMSCRDFDQIIQAADRVIVADYRHGLLTEERIKEIVAACLKHDKPLFVASQISQKESNHYLYRSEGTIFVLNEKEALEAFWDGHFVYITMGKEGSGFFSGIGDMLCGEYASQVKAIDATGAGDAYLALCASLPEDVETKDVLKISNLYAALSTTKFGANPPDINEFWERYEKL